MVPPVRAEWHCYPILPLASCLFRPPASSEMLVLAWWYVPLIPAFPVPFWPSWSSLPDQIRLATNPQQVLRWKGDLALLRLTLALERARLCWQLPGNVGPHCDVTLTGCWLTTTLQGHCEQSSHALECTCSAVAVCVQPTCSERLTPCSFPSAWDMKECL